MTAPKLTSEQLHVIDVAADLNNLSTPTAVSGPAGSGKTLVAGAIAMRLSAQSALDLFGDAPGNSVFVVTYTNQLKNYMASQLIDGAAAESSDVKVMTVHKYLLRFLEANGFGGYFFNESKYAKNKGVMRRSAFLKSYIDDNKKALGLKNCLADVDFLDEEISWLLGRGIRNRKNYLEIQRAGRRTGLSSDQRNKVYDAYKAYMKHLAQASKPNKKIIDFDDIGSQVLNLCACKECTTIANHLIVDEVQDLPITWIEALRKTVSGKVVLVGDTSQSIYGRGFTWQELAGERIRPLRLTEDFRNTQQIYLAARSLMDFDVSPEKDVGQVGQRRRGGSKPKLVFCNGKQMQLDRIRMLVDDLRRDDKDCAIAIALPRHGEYFDKLSSSCPGALVTTYHSLKGLEAEHVILASLDAGEFEFSNEYTQEDTNRHLLYVGMTRAKKTLTLMAATDNPSQVLYELSADHIELDESENPDAHQALLEMRTAQANKARKVFESLACKKAEKEEAVDEFAQELEEAGADEPPASQSRQDERIAELEHKLKKAQEQLAKATEKFQRQEDELRVYRARELSDRAVHEEEVAGRAKSRQFADDAKILILGISSGVKPKDLPGIFKSAGLPRDAYELLDYDEVHSEKFDARHLIGTIQYSDIFVSTTPHKAKGIGDSSSLVEFLESNSTDLPKLTIFRNDDGTLKSMSKTDLKIALTQSDLYAAVRGIGLG